MEKVVKFNVRAMRQCLLNKDWDQRKLARAANISEPTITRMVGGKAFTLDTLARMAEHLECHPFDLLTVEGFDPPKTVVYEVKYTKTKPKL